MPAIPAALLKVKRMKFPWHTVRAVLHNAAVQLVARLAAALLAALGAVTAVDPQAAVDLRNAALVQPPEAVVRKP